MYHVLKCSINAIVVFFLAWVECKTGSKPTFAFLIVLYGTLSNTNTSGVDVSWSPTHVVV